MHDTMRKPGSFLKEVCLAESDARGIAGGLAWGVVLGLVPIANLTWAVLAIIVLALRINLLGMVITALFGALLASRADPWFDVVGRALLTTPLLQQFYSVVLDLPWMRWSGLNNTVVAGSLLVGLCLRYPLEKILQRYLRTAIPRWRAEHTTPQVTVGKSTS